MKKYLRVMPLLWWCAVVGAQAPKPDAAAAAAAMERAQRLAGNPMRVILQAGKIRRKPADGDAAGDGKPADPKAVDPRAAPAEPAVAAVPAARMATLRPAASNAAVPVLERQAQDPAAAGAAGAAGLAVLAEAPVAAPPPRTLSAAAWATTALATPSGPLPASDAVAAPALLAVPSATPAPLPAPPQPALAPPPPASLPAQSPPPAQVSSPPKLLAMIEPELPVRLMEQLGRVSDVAVDLTILPDGTVSNVVVLPPVPRPLLRPITAALAQWRFEPASGIRVHRVQLVFN